MRILMLVGLAVATAAADPGTPQPDRTRVAFSRLKDSGKLRDTLLFERHVQKRELGPGGEVRSESTTLYRQDPWEEVVVTRVIQRDGKSLTPEEVTKQEQALVKAVEELRRGKPKTHWSQEPWTDELPDALVFRRIGSEMRAGRANDIIVFTPRPGYKAKNSRARIFEKIRGKLWLDTADTELTRVEVEVTDTISVGFGFLGRIEKGTEFEMERKKWDSGVWFDAWQRVRFDLRVLMVKSIRQEIETRWANVMLKPANLH